jgi:hypothetical protein
MAVFLEPAKTTGIYKDVEYIRKSSKIINNDNYSTCY